MKLNQANIGDIVLLPVKVLDNMAWASPGAPTVRVEFEEGNDGKTIMHLNRHTEVHPMISAPPPIMVDDIVFVVFEDGKWRVADMYNDQVFLTPHYDSYEPKNRIAMVRDVTDCYHVSPKEIR